MLVFIKSVTKFLSAKSPFVSTPESEERYDANFVLSLHPPCYTAMLAWYQSRVDLKCSFFISNVKIKRHRPIHSKKKG